MFGSRKKVSLQINYFSTIITKPSVLVQMEEKRSWDGWGGSDAAKKSKHRRSTALGFPPQYRLCALICEETDFLVSEDRKVWPKSVAYSILSLFALSVSV